MRYTINDYFDDEGGIRRHVKEFVVLKGDRPKDFPNYIGVGSIEMQLDSQIIPHQFSANLNAETLDEAFEKFDSIMEEAAKAATKDLERDLEREMHEYIVSQKRAEATKIIVPK